MFSETYMELNESVGPQRKDNIFTCCDSLRLKWIPLALIVSTSQEIPTHYQHRPIRVEGKFDMKPDRRIYDKISIYFRKYFQKLHGTEWIYWTPEKGQNIYLMEFTASKMEFCSRDCSHFPGKHLRNINIDPSELRQNLTWNPVEGYITRYPKKFSNVFRNYMTRALQTPKTQNLWDCLSSKCSSKKKSIMPSSDSPK